MSPKEGEPGDPGRLLALVRYYEAALKAPAEKRADLALELCHSLIIELSNHCSIHHHDP